MNNVISNLFLIWNQIKPILSDISNLSDTVCINQFISPLQLFHKISFSILHKPSAMDFTMTWLNTSKHSLSLYSLDDTFSFNAYIHFLQFDIIWFCSNWCSQNSPNIPAPQWPWTVFHRCSWFIFTRIKTWLYINLLTTSC